MTSTKPLRTRQALVADRAFTLIEMLVVIAIIAILAGILTPAIRGAMKNAQERKANLEITSIVTASQSYYSEYGVWPCADNGQADRAYHATGGSTNDVRSQSRVTRVLRGLDTTLNARKLSFLDIKNASFEGVDMKGNTYTPEMSYFVDPWGNPYIVSFDTSFDENVDLENVDGWRPTNRLERVRVAVYSLGPDAIDLGVWNALSSAKKLESAILSWKN